MTEKGNRGSGPERNAKKDFYELRRNADVGKGGSHLKKENQMVETISVADNSTKHLMVLKSLCS